VRGKPGQQRRCLAVLPGRGVEQREPLHDESPDELGQGREDVEGQSAARGGGVQRLVQDRNPVPRRRSPATMVIRSCHLGFADLVTCLTYRRPQAVLRVSISRPR
jgi:hypothetical protein